MVIALTLLVACWVGIAGVFGYLWLVTRTLGRSHWSVDVSSTTAIIAMVVKVLLHLAGWVLLFVAFFGSDANATLLDHVWADSLMKAIAAVPAASAAALATVSIVVFLPGGGDGRWLRAGLVLMSVLLTVLTFGGLLFLTIEFGLPPDGSGLPELIYSLGYAPLLLVSGLFLIIAVAMGFGAAWTHRRAGGIRLVLFAVGMVVTYQLLKHYGPIGIPGTEELVSTKLVNARVGLAGVISFFVSGVLAAVFPAMTVEGAE